MVTARRRSARSGRSRKEPAPAICEERGTYILLLASCCSGCRRGGGRPRVRVGRLRGAGAVREDEAVAVVEQFFEVLAPVQSESLPVGFEGLKLRAGEAVQPCVVLYDPPEDV